MSASNAWFKMCYCANEWYKATKALKLPTLLKGEVLAIWLELSDEVQKDYKEVKRIKIVKIWRHNRSHLSRSRAKDQALSDLDTGA